MCYLEEGCEGVILSFPPFCHVYFCNVRCWYGVGLLARLVEQNGDHSSSATPWFFSYNLSFTKQNAGLQVQDFLQTYVS
jgi:hypothetical protein